MIPFLAIATPVLAVFSDDNGESRQELIQRAILSGNPDVLFSTMTREERRELRKELLGWYDGSANLDEARDRLLVLWSLFRPYPDLPRILMFGGPGLYFTQQEGSPSIHKIPLGDRFDAKMLNPRLIEDDLGLNANDYLGVEAWDETRFLMGSEKGVFLLPRDRYVMHP